MLNLHRRTNKWLGYGWGVAAPSICTLIDWPLRQTLGPASILMTYLLGVFLVAARYGRHASIIASLLSAPAFAFYFAHPIFSFAINDLENIVGLGVMIVVANVTSNFLERVQAQAELSWRRETRANALYRLSQALSDAHDASEVARIAVDHIHDNFKANSVLLFADEQGRPLYPADKPLAYSLRGVDLSTARRLTERQTAVLSAESADRDRAFFSLERSQTAQGILVLQLTEAVDFSDPEFLAFFDTFRNLIAQTLERLHLTEQANQAKLLAEAESLRNALLSAISHDLRTPLTRIIGAGTALIEHGARFSAEEALDFNRVMLDEAQRMSDLAGKILDMARLSAGEIILHREWNVVEELVGSALTRLAKNIGTRPVRTALPNALPLVWIDAVLVEQVLTNLIENAIKYTPAGSPIDIGAELLPTTLCITVADYGPGIPKGMEEKIFEKFYRYAPETDEGGVGLGLALCRAIIEAHGGSLQASNRSGQGALFVIRLPLREVPQFDLQEGVLA